MAGIMGIGLKSLMAYQAAIQNAAQNLENARTPFYSRRQINFVESLFNSGVEISDVKRVYDDVANRNLLRSGSAVGNANSFLVNLNDFEKLLDNDSTTISNFLNQSLISLQDLTKDVGSSEIRSAFLAKLSSISHQFNRLSGEISKRRNDINQNIATDVDHVNTIIDQISRINTQISQLSSQDRLSLLDQRNALTHELAKYMNFDTHLDANDGITLTLSNGIELLATNVANHISLHSDPADPSKSTLFMENNNSKIDITRFISDGELRGLMRVQTEALDVAEHGLNRLALTLSAVFNKQNRSGLDLYGNLGSNIFTDINETALQNARFYANQHNTGSAQMAVTIEDYTKLTNSDYKLTFSDPTHYTLTRLSDNQIMAQGDSSSLPHAINIDGFSVTLTGGTYTAGDSYLLSPSKGAMENIALLLTDGSKLAMAFPVSASSSQQNTGSGNITVTDITDISNSSFQVNKSLNPPIKIVFNSETSFSLYDANTSTLIEGPMTYDPAKGTNIFPTTGGYDPGYRISLTGVVKSGDEFTINYNTNVVGDNRNALKFADLYQMKLIDSGKLTLNEAYRMTASGISSTTNLAKGILESDMTLFEQAELRYNEISGVSNFEEMANLAQYQESYQACAQVIQVAKTIFDTIIQMTG